ncbi:hypothetical protein BLNAU_1991 [Blattamonas nauphoetae]|uniref:Uncharacterized protein n=1 Tax=Blattamonas nauphoetae TaxID=2049346 RepID=A0ABQ9YGT2_9EUKA|nr:hypothetical protein BLNAU_17058 [Blattamonas nauphoetae]KAK2962968.1 hypothetical protein BLNAU_1991 [Blattamonas nauphoetae]
MTLRSRLSNDPNSFLRTLLVCWECADCWCRRTDSEITSNCPEMVCSFGFVVLNAAVFDCPIVNRPLSKQFLSVDYPLSLISRSCNQAQTAIRYQRIQTTPDDSVGQHKVSSATNIVRDGTTCCATCFGRSTASSHSEANRIVIRSIKHLHDADSGQYPRTPSRQHSSKRALFSTLSSLSSYRRPFHSKRQNGAPTQVVTVPSLNNPTFTLDKQHSDNEVLTKIFQKQHFKHRTDKVDEVDWNLANETLFSTTPSHFIRLFSQHEAHRPKQHTKGKHRLRRCTRHTRTSQTQTSLRTTRSSDISNTTPFPSQQLEWYNPNIEPWQSLNDNVDKGAREAEENQRHIETEVLDELAVDAVDTSVAFEQQLRESSLRDVVLKMKQFLKQSSILMPTLPKSDAPQPFLLLARPKLESMLSSTTNLEKTLPQKSATTTRPTTAIEAAAPADDGRKAEKQTSDSHDKLKLSRQTQKLRKEEVKFVEHANDAESEHWGMEQEDEEERLHGIDESHLMNTRNSATMQRNAEIMT